MSFQFSAQAWEEYLFWQSSDKKIVKRINDLFQDIIRGGYSGIGKPEPLKGNFSGYWSRRIDEKNRLVYKVRVRHVLYCNARDIMMSRLIQWDRIWRGLGSFLK